MLNNTSIISCSIIFYRRQLKHDRSVHKPFGRGLYKFGKGNCRLKETLLIDGSRSLSDTNNFLEPINFILYKENLVPETYLWSSSHCISVLSTVYYRGRISDSIATNY
jgi:hypothetical protein